MIKKTEIALVADGMLATADTNRSIEFALPFTVQVTPLGQPDPVPDYLGGRWTGDYPPCAVMIGNEFWVIHRPAGTRIHRFKGTNIENAVIQPDGDAPPFPVERPYMLGGAMWYDETENKLYTAMHCETPGYPTIDRPNAAHPTINRQIHLASSGDKGLSWRYEGPIVTRDHPERPLKGSDFSGLYWDGGDGDFYLYVDERGGFIYIFSTHYTWFKPGIRRPEFARYCVARCAITDKMAPGKWKRFYNGAWNEPGLGGKASYVNGFHVIYNKWLRKYLSFNYGSGLSVCDDLSKQDWTPVFNMGNNLWGGPLPKTIAYHVVDEDKVDMFAAGRVMFLYSYFNGQLGGAYRIDIGPGEMSAASGFVPSAFYTTTKECMGDLGGIYAAEKPIGHPFRIVSAEPGQLYHLEPLFDSADPVESRRTRRVGCASPEAHYAGKWQDETGDLYYENWARVSAAAGASVEFSFQSAEIYWRVFRGDDCGKADIFVDGTLERTVDCYASAGTPFMFGFIKTGLDPKRKHTVKIVVRGEKNPASNGTAIRHLLFEYAAESYRASDCFSGVMGKHGWYYQEREPARITPYGADQKLTGPWYSNMRFEHPNWIGCGEKNNPEVGYFHLVPGVGSAAVRAWVAPHGGKIRIEGRVSSDLPEGTVNVEIRHRHDAAVSDLWPRHVVASVKPETHDLETEISKDDVLYFVVEKNGKTSYGGDRTTWDPIVTYIESLG